MAEVSIVKEISELRCKRCKEVKPLSDFDRGFFGKQGFDVYCHECRIEIDKITDAITEKRCRNCGRIKSISEFWKNASTRDGFYKECLDCQEENSSRKRKRKNESAWDGRTKTCSVCNLQKPTYEFPPRRNKLSYYASCYNCINERVRQKVLKYEREREVHGWPIKKRCKVCGRIFPSDEFHLYHSTKDGLADKCNECNRGLYKQWLESVIENRSRKRINRTELKECRICHILKPFSSYIKDSRTKDGYRNLCTACNNKIREEAVMIWASQRKEKGLELKKIQCRICNRILPVEMFSRNRREKKGYYNLCKDCTKQREQKAEVRWERERKEAMFEFSLNATVEKKCKICGQILPFSKFWKRRASKDGYGHYCKTCESMKTTERNKRLKERGFPEELIPKEKKCSNCGRILPSFMFSRDVTASDGLNGHCKECFNQYYKIYYRRPEVKQRIQEYKRRPEIMERHRQLARVYYHQNKKK